MSYRKSSWIALRALRRNRLQTALTVLGMMIGVGTVLAMVAVGSGAERSITGQVRAAGMNIIVVSSGNYRMQQQWTSQGEGEEPIAWTPSQRPTSLRRAVFVPSDAHMRFLHIQGDPSTNPDQGIAKNGENLAGLGAASTLSLADVHAIATLSGVQAVSGGLHENVTARAGNTSWATQLHGEQPTLFSIRRAWVLSHGRFFTDGEGSDGQPVAVLGSLASEKLFGSHDPVGNVVTITGQDFKVIGVVASSTWMVPATPGDGMLDAIYVPVQTAQRLFGRQHLDTITLSTVSTGDVEHVSKQISTELRRRHHLSSATPDDFTIASQAHSAIAKGGMRTDISRAMMGNATNLDKVTLAELSKSLERSSRTMSLLLASIAAVSLVVGGIGIMNIMMLSVTERTREIGVRRAVGAQSAEVMQQFLMEAVFLSVGGGLCGIALGFGVALLVTHWVRWSTELSWPAVATSFSISVLIGIVFGWYPARQASRLSPMTSLRYE